VIALDAPPQAAIVVDPTAWAARLDPFDASRALPPPVEEELNPGRPRGASRRS
jgi:hypothetical protein